MGHQLVQFQPEAVWLDFEGTSDLTVRIGTHKFDCHRCVLLPRCSFFRSVCPPDLKPRHMFVNLEGFPGGKAIFQMIVAFCYGHKIAMSADASFLHLSYGASFLGMQKTSLFDTDNLEEICEYFLKCKFLSAWGNILNTIELLNNGNLMLPRSRISLYLHECTEALALVMQRKIEQKELEAFMHRFIMLPEDKMLAILPGLGQNWPQCSRRDILVSFVSAAKKVAPGSKASNVLGLVAKSLVLGKLQYHDGDDNGDGGHRLLLIKDAAPIAYVIVLLDAYIDACSFVDDDVMNLRRRYFEILKPLDLGMASPEPALQLISNFIEEEYRLLPFAEIGTKLMLQYLHLFKKTFIPLSFITFLVFAKALSVALTDSHNILYDEIKGYLKMVDLSEKNKVSLQSLVNCAKLSRSRAEEVFASDFPCCLKQIVFSLMENNAYLRRELKKKHFRDSDDYHDEKPSTTLSYHSFSKDQVAEVDKDKQAQEPPTKIMLYTPNLSSDLSNSLYISVMTLDYMCFSFSMGLVDSVSMVEKEILRETQLNSVRLPSKWHLVYKGKKFQPHSTLYENGIEMYGMLYMQTN